MGTIKTQTYNFSGSMFILPVFMAVIYGGTCLVTGLDRKTNTDLLSPLYLSVLLHYLKHSHIIYQV